MRTLTGIILLIWGVAWLVHLVGLLDCGCANVTEFHFIGVAVNFIGGFAMMLPDREE